MRKVFTRGFAFTAWCDGFAEGMPEKKTVHLRSAGAWDEPIRNALLANFEPEPQGAGGGGGGGGSSGGGRKMGTANEVERTQGRLVNMKTGVAFKVTLVRWDNGKTVSILVDGALVRVADDGTVLFDGDGGLSSQFHPMTPREDGSARMVNVAHRKRGWALGCGPGSANPALGVAEGPGLHGRWRLIASDGPNGEIRVVPLASRI